MWIPQPDAAAFDRVQHLGSTQNCQQDKSYSTRDASKKNPKSNSVPMQNLSDPMD